MKNIYLITSTSYRLLEDEIKNIVKDNLYTTYDLNFVELDEVLEEAAYFSLFDDKKYIVVKNANIFTTVRKAKETTEETVSKKDELLIKYLEEPNPNTVLIFTMYGKANGTKKITKIIKDRYEYIQIDDLKPSEIQKRIDKMFKDDGFKVTTDIEYYIVNNSLNNYDLACNEVDKIKLYYIKGCVVDFNDVKNIVSNNLEDNNFKFIDSVINRDISEAFKMYDDLMRQKVMPIMLIIMISKEFRHMWIAKHMMMNSSKQDMMKVLGFKFEFQIDKVINNSYNYSNEELEEYLVKIADIDYKIKSGGISDKLALQTLIMDVCK